jgi:hypothetical protein
MTAMRDRLLPFRVCLPLLAAGLVLTGCGDEKKIDPDATGPSLSASQDGVLKDSWIFHVVEDPSRLGPFEKGATGDAWLSLFHNDLRPAVRRLSPACTPSEAPLAARSSAGYPCVALARTHIEIAMMYAGAADIERVARRQFYAHRTAHEGEVLGSVHQAYFEGVVLLASGETAAGSALLTTYATTTSADPMLAALATHIVAGLDSGDPLVARLWGTAAVDAPTEATLGDLPESADASEYAARLAIAVSVAKGDVATANSQLRASAASKPDLREKLAQRGGAVSSDVNLAHGDPLLQRSMSRLHALQAVQAIGGAGDLALLQAQADKLLGRSVVAVTAAPSVEEGLALVLFSTTMTPSDLTNSGPSPTLKRLATGFPELSEGPSSELADLDGFVSVSNDLKATIIDLMKGTSEGAASLVADMGLGDRFMSRLMQERARQYQEAFDVHMDAGVGADVASAGVAVRSLLEHALDKNPSPPSQQLKRARISFRNDPPSLVELARANLDTRRPYDANEYIRPLTEVYPELIPVREALASLDSAWNPAREGSVR